MDQEPWFIYQTASTNLLNLIAADLGLSRVEPAQKVPGKSGTEWAIDAKGIADGTGALVIVEARRRKRSADQEQVASLAYRVEDTGAAGAIMVSPMSFQAGAAKVAAAANIKHVRLAVNSTDTVYVMQFLHSIFVGLSDSLLDFKESLTAIVVSGACNDGAHKECGTEDMDRRLLDCLARVSHGRRYFASGWRATVGPEDSQTGYPIAW